MKDSSSSLQEEVEKLRAHVYMIEKEKK